MITRKNLSILAVALLILAGGLFYAYRARAPHEPVQAGPGQAAADEQAVREVVSAFGGKLRMVNLAAPKEDVIRAIRENYGPFVSAELLAAWEANPRLAPGRLTSSPWPESIKILLVEHPDDSYEVQGLVLEVTSAELAAGSGAADQYPVALKLRQREGRWVITGFSKALPSGS